MPVYKNKANNTWYVKYKNKTKRGFKTRSDALTYEAKMKLSMIDNINCEPVSIFDVANDYLTTLYKNTRYGTYAKCNNVIKNIIMPNIQNKKISTISEKECRDFRDYVVSTSYSTIYKNYILNKYKAIFKHAKKYFKLQNDPSIILDTIQYTHEELMKKRDKEQNIWTQDEFSKFIQCVKKPTYKALFTFLFMTGCRLGEALALSWNDIDFEKKIVHITKSLTRKVEHGSYAVGDTKNFSSIRDISLGNNLSLYLLEYKKNQSLIAGFNDSWFIFGNEIPLPQTSIDRIKEKAIKESGVKRIKIHDLRHSHASILISNGMNIVAVSKRLGHSDINMTLKVYTHLLKKNNDEIIEYLDNSSQNLLTK